MNETGKKNYHFNSNIRSKSGSKASMSNNEDRYLRALEIQARKREIHEEELEKQKIIEEAEKAAAEEKTRQEAEAVEEEAVKEGEQVEETPEPVAEEAAPVTKAPPAAKPAPSGNFVAGPTPRQDFTSAEKAAMLKRAKAHAAEVAKRKGK